MHHSLVTAFAVGLALLPLGCAHQQDAKTTNEVTLPDTLTYTMQVDATRIVRGTGLDPVPAMAKLINEDLSSYFKVHEAPGSSSSRRELVGEAPAPGYGVRVVVDERPDQYAFVTIDVVSMKPDASMTPVTMAPYSVHFGIDAVRAALSSLRGSNRGAMSAARFSELRAQASALAARHEDPPIDATTYARTPRPLDNADELPRYYAPPQTTSTLRGE